MSPGLGLALEHNLSLRSHSHRGDSGMVKMVPMSTREKASGMPNGILHEASMLGPDVICDAPRLIQASRVYPKLFNISATISDILGSRYSRHEEAIEHNMLSPVGSRTALRLPDRNRGAEDTNAQADNGASNHELCQSEGRSAQRLAEQRQRRSQEDGPSTAQKVPNQHT